MRRILLALATLLAVIAVTGTARAGKCYEVEIPHPDGGPPMVTTICP